VSPDLNGTVAEETAARASLEREAQRLRGDGLDVTVETLSGSSPAEGILRFTETSSVDLIAMTTHGRGAVARFILGSVADKVIRGGTVPVLLQRAS
jgi:nucleotide-binding universal stress UspA family protein